MALFLLTVNECTRGVVFGPRDSMLFIRRSILRMIAAAICAARSSGSLETSYPVRIALSSLCTSVCIYLYCVEIYRLHSSKSRE